MNNALAFILIFSAFVTVLAGVLFMFTGWEFPGSVHFTVNNVHVYLPIATSILLSIILTVGLNLVLNLRRQ